MLHVGRRRASSGSRYRIAQQSNGANSHLCGSTISESARSMPAKRCGPRERPAPRLRRRRRRGTRDRARHRPRRRLPGRRGCRGSSSPRSPRRRRGRRGRIEASASLTAEAPSTARRRQSRRGARRRPSRSQPRRSTSGSRRSRPLSSERGGAPSSRARPVWRAVTSAERLPTVPPWTNAPPGRPQPCKIGDPA